MTSERTIDELKGTGLILIQPRKGFRVNVDTILLAGFTKVKHGDKVCELGCAHGAVSLILGGRTSAQVTGLDIQADLIEMATENAALNGLSQKVSFLHHDLRLVDQVLPPQGFDVVVSNPPYGDPERHRQGIREGEIMARHGILCSLDDIGRSFGYLLKHGGRGYTVFTAERMVGLMESMRKNGLEPKAVLPVYPRDDKEGSVFLMKSIKGAAPGLRILPPLFIGDCSGNSTEKLLSYYTVEGCPCP